MTLTFHISPITRKRLKRFKSHKRAFLSFLLLAFMYVLSLFSEFLCNSVPIVIFHKGKTYFPIFKFYPDNEFTGSGLNTRPDYHALARSKDFIDSGSTVIWPLIPSGPDDIVSTENLAKFLRVTVNLHPVTQAWGLSISPDSKITRIRGTQDKDFALDSWNGQQLDTLWQIPSELNEQLSKRFANQEAPGGQFECKGINGTPDCVIAVTAFTPRQKAIKELRLTIRKSLQAGSSYSWSFEKSATAPVSKAETFSALAQEHQQTILDAVKNATENSQYEQELSIEGISYRLAVETEQVRFPFRPVPGHWFGIDDAGRDVLVRLLYALRTSLSFGIILVCCSMFIGSLIGLTQGYLGGWVDLGGQRLIEIWSALPFLYVVILMGSIYGPGFWLMIFCYAIFNWIGISHYMRGEMLRLRKLPFVESARCLGLSPVRIMLKHVLPNALVPLITFFPFSLVGAIGSLAALDYLGFGLPPPTPSIGQLLQQAQSQRWAWWLILYPSTLLFLVMMLGVFIGEGIREAFDPKTQGRFE